MSKLKTTQQNIVADVPSADNIISLCKPKQPTRLQKTVAVDNLVPYNSGPEFQWELINSFHELSHDDAEAKAVRIFNIIKHSMEMTGGDTND